MGVWVHRSPTTADIPDGTIATADIANLAVTAGKLAANAVETAKILDANVTGAKLSAPARAKVFTYQVENLAAGVDIANRQIWQLPQGGTSDITRIEFLFTDATAGVDGANTLQLTVAVAGTTVADTTALTSDQAADTVNAPTLANNTGLAAGAAVDFNITQGATADAGLIQVVIYYVQAV